MARVTRYVRQREGLKQGSECCEGRTLHHSGDDGGDGGGEILKSACSGPPMRRLRASRRSTSDFASCVLGALNCNDRNLDGEDIAIRTCCDNDERRSKLRKSQHKIS